MHVLSMVFCNAAGRAILGGIALAFAAGVPALAAPSLGDALFGKADDSRRAAPPPVARYVAETGSSFVFDRTTSQGLLKFEGSPEVWVLEPQAAPRGDVIYRNDLGEPMLRVTRLGGLTLFNDQAPEGVAVALTGESSPLKLAMISPGELIRRIRIAATRASRAAQRPIDIDFSADSDSAPLVADAAMVLADAVVRMAQRGDGKKLLGAFGKISIKPGKKPSVKVDKSVLEIRVTPEMGLAGRPSSERIAYAVGAR
jgi:hypothetical protein